MQNISHMPLGLETPELKFVTIRTTLGGLIEAIGEGMEPEEDNLVPEIVMHLIETGRIKFH